MSITASRVIESAPDTVFSLISDPTRLPEWNRVVRRTVDAPAQMLPGARWTVEMHAMGQTWRSVSSATEVDRAARRFAYRSGTDDGNPSYADWAWAVTPSPSDASGCVVTVSADLHPATFWRRVLLARVRARQLGRELPESLDRLAEAVASSKSS